MILDFGFKLIQISALMFEKKIEKQHVIRMKGRAGLPYLNLNLLDQRSSALKYSIFRSDRNLIQLTNLIL